MNFSIKDGEAHIRVGGDKLKISLIRESA